METFENLNRTDSPSFALTGALIDSGGGDFEVSAISKEVSATRLVRLESSKSCKTISSFPSVNLSATVLRFKKALPLELMERLPVKGDVKSEESTPPFME